jgi:hypothetical protein
MLKADNQRWRERRESYRPAAEPIDPRRYGVDLIAERDAKDFVIRHHYSASYPAARLRVGLFRAGLFGSVKSELVGVAVFSVPMQGAVISHWTGQAPESGVELGRLVLRDEVEGNGESWFLARAFRLLASELPAVKAVVSFSDPLRRYAADGGLVTPGHVGTVYQALNGRHVGRSKARYLLVDPAGRVVSERALSKLRNDEKGAAYAYEQLQASGAPVRRIGEEGPEYVARVLRYGPFRRVKHPGNLAYVWPTLTAGRDVVRGFLPALPFPKARDVVVGVDDSATGADVL